MKVFSTFVILAALASSAQAGLRGTHRGMMQQSATAIADDSLDAEFTELDMDLADADGSESRRLADIPETDGLVEARMRYEEATALTRAAKAKASEARAAFLAAKKEQMPKPEKKALLKALRGPWRDAVASWRKSNKVRKEWLKNLKREIRLAKQQQAKPACKPCKAFTLECVACAAGMKPQMFCRKNAGHALCQTEVNTAWRVTEPVKTACPTACGEPASTVSGSVECVTDGQEVVPDRMCARAGPKPAVPTGGCAATKFCAWQTRWGDDMCDAECGGAGARRMDVFCQGAAKAVVDAARCDPATRPKGTQPCRTVCHRVDNSGEDGTTLASCLAKSKAARKLDASVTTRCQLEAGRYTEVVKAVDGLRAVTIEPADDSAEGAVVFDGTDALTAEQLDFSPVEGRENLLVSAPLEGVTRRGQLVVDGRAVQCLDQNQHAIKRTPCFLFDPAADAARDSAMNAKLEEVQADVESLANRGWATPFALADAESFFLGDEGDAMRSTEGVAWWFDEASQQLYVDTDRLGDAESISIRAKNAARAELAVALRNKNSHVTLRNLKFLGASCCGAGPTKWNEKSTDLRLVGNHFLYAPRRVRMFSSPRRSRGGGAFVEVRDNTIAFAEDGALEYYATPAKITRNVFLFNTLSGWSPNRKANKSTVQSLGHNDVITDNSFLYNGEAGGVVAWARGYTVARNLFLGQSYLSRWKDAACIHAQIGGQFDARFNDNWFLGPSNVRGIRLDTSKGATNPGRFTTAKRNVFWVSTGSDMTVKGNDHTIAHNTGKEMNVVWSWGAIKDHNSRTETAYNALQKLFTRGSSKGLPGNHHDNYANAGLGKQLEENPANWFPSSRVSTRDDVPTWTAKARVFDFRPKEGSDLLLEGGKFAGAYGRDLAEYDVPGQWDDLDAAFPTM